MTNKELDGILDLTYEMEGLLLLALSKDEADDTRCHLLELVGAKARKINDCIPDDTPVLEEEEMERESILETPDWHEEETPTEKQSSSNGNIMGYLSLNDKFRFRRELFADSDAGLKEALGVIAGFGTVEEAEDYIYNELRLDPENPAVVDFMTVVENYFSR